jgi:hypothetical protein
MTAKTLIEEAKDIVVNAAGFDNPETLEAGIPLMIWMHRNNVERKKVMDTLSMLVRERKSLEASKAVIMLKLKADGEEEKQGSGDIWKETTK